MVIDDFRARPFVSSSSGRAVVIDDEEVLRRFPRTLINRDNVDFYRGWLDKQLRMNRCSRCEFWHNPPRPMCPRCLSEEVSSREVSGRGVIYLLMYLHQGPPVEGIQYDPPYPVVTVELDEQTELRFTSTLLQDSSGVADIGSSVELTWITREGEPFPVFRLTALESA
jgi:uncharacterized OB-fold protein